MPNRLLPDLTKLVGYKTVTGNQAEIRQAFDYIDERLLSIFPFQKNVYLSNGAQSMVWSTQDTLAPDVILCAHIDVVPASEKMFTLKKSNGKLVGRGAADMKFAIAVFIDVVAQIEAKFGLQNVSLAIMVTSDEEKGGFNGVNYLVNEIGYRAKLVIIPDGGNNWHVTTRAKGASWIKVSATGSSAHASLPWEGENAIDQLVKALSWLKSELPNPDSRSYVTTINLGTISGGTTPNQVAETATATVDVRYTKKLTAQTIIDQLLRQFPRLAIETIVDKPYFEVDPKNKYITQWEKLLRAQENIAIDGEIFVAGNASADHHYFSAHNIPVLMSKPRGGLIHTEKEWISESEFYLYSKLLGEYLTSIMGGDQYVKANPGVSLP